LVLLLLHLFWKKNQGTATSAKMKGMGLPFSPLVLLSPSLPLSSPLSFLLCLCVSFLLSSPSFFPVNLSLLSTLLPPSVSFPSSLPVFLSPSTSLGPLCFCVSSLFSLPSFFSVSLISDSLFRYSSLPLFLCLSLSFFSLSLFSLSSPLPSTTPLALGLVHTKYVT
jgi:hypothetical protein